MGSTPVPNHAGERQNSFAETLRQASMKIHESMRSVSTSRRRTIGLEDLERGASRYCKQNSLTFGQVVPVDDDESCRVFNPFTEAFEGDDQICDVESGGKGDGDNHLQLRPSHQPDSKTVKAEKPKRLTAKVADSSGGRSRFETIILEQSLFNVYKRLFFTSVTLNLIALVLAVTGHFPYAQSQSALFSVANILAAVVVRNEVFLRLLFWLAVHLLGHRWVPTPIKTMTTALLQSVGGIHSGCGCSGIIWLVYTIVKSFPIRKYSSDGIVGVAFGILFLLVLSSMAAFPVFRHSHHNVYERVHRFAGWSSLALVWVYIVLSAFWSEETQSYQTSRRMRLVRMQSLWLIVATTILIILPWLFVRKVPVETVVPSTKLNSLLHFKGGVQPGLLARISPSPFSEWHAFGIISDGKDKHTVLAGAVGDFTKSLVANPPTHIWVRSLHFSGLPYLTNMYSRVVHAATGSGICVFLSFLMQPTKADVHIVWITKKVRESYGEEMWEVIQNVPSERLTLIDTAVSGRPQTKELVVKTAKMWRAEAVIVTSNPRGTNEIVSGCRAAGIPAFGPIWDS